MAGNTKDKCLFNLLSSSLVKRLNGYLESVHAVSTEQCGSAENAPQKRRAGP